MAWTPHARSLDIYPPPAAETVLRIGGAQAELLFRGQAPFTAGLMQLNARVPMEAAAEARVVLRIGAAETELSIPLYSSISSARSE